jgi:hypothetical protein
MMHVECPWCAGPATVEAGATGAFECADCAIRVEIAPDPAHELVARAA